MSSASPENPRKWRFTWETLAHIPTLRLYLFNPEIDPSRRCNNLKASLCYEESLLLVSWIEEGAGDVLLRVPVPRVLIDLSSPLDCRATDDHIEIKLVLVLPVDHPVVADLLGVLDSDGEGFSDRSLPLSLDSDLKGLSSGGVHLFCKICSTKLTRNPLRRFLEMPSVNWREVADNWFGACCCSFGGISEKLVSEYINNYDCTEGTCLLDSASIIVCQDGLEGYTFQQCSDGYSEHTDKVDLVDNGELADTVKRGLCCGIAAEGIPDICVTSTCEPHKDRMMISNHRTKLNDNNPLFCPFLSSPDCFCNVTEGMPSFLKENINAAQLSLNKTQDAIDVEGSNLSSGNLGKSFANSLEDKSSSNYQSHCCGNRTNYVVNHMHERSGLGVSLTSLKAHQSTDSSLPQKSKRWLHNSSLGSGFMIRTSNLSNDVEWVEVLCRHCSSPLGSYPSLTNITNAPIDGGIRLLKFYVSTYIPIGGPRDVFRKYTLQRVFVNLLLESAADELSFRTVVRDLKSKSPMLQLVLLNSGAWCSSGYCFENETTCPLSKADLQPIVKVLFSDCGSATEANSRIIEDWSTKNHAEEVYMMAHQIQELTEYLKLGVNRLPSSCSSLQGMLLSSMER